jgi:hypothetical protein
MEQILELEKKLRGMTPEELYAYAQEQYPDIPDAGIGKPKLVIRRLLNLEREKLNKEET